MRDARLIVVNGGSTLLQAIACGAACVAVPIAGDQRERIRRCVAAGVAVEAPLAAAEIAARSLALLRDESVAGGVGAACAGSCACRRHRGRVERARYLEPYRHLRVRRLRDRAHAECIAAGLRSRSALVSSPHEKSGRAARGGGMAGATGALPERALWVAHLGAARLAARGRDVAVLHQIKLSALEARALRRTHPAANIRRGRCHLRPQAAPAGRAGRRFALAPQEIRGDLPLGRCGRRRQRRARGRRAARGPRGGDPAHVDRRRLLSGGSARPRRCPDHRVDRQSRESRSIWRWSARRLPG